MKSYRINKGVAHYTIIIILSVVIPEPNQPGIDFVWLGGFSWVYFENNSEKLLSSIF